MTSTSQKLTQTSAVRLEASLPDWCVLTWNQALVTTVFVVIFLYFSYLPPTSPKVWHDVKLGQMEMSTANEIAESVPLSEGMRHGFVGVAGVKAVRSLYAWQGVECLCFAYGVLQTFVAILWTQVFFQLTRKWWSVFGAIAIVVWGFPEHAGFHSQSFGQLGFVCLALLLVYSKPKDAEHFHWRSVKTRFWLLTFLLFVIWSNLHASAFLGIFWLGCFAFSRAISQFDRIAPFAFLRDREFQVRVWLLEMVSLATLFTPAGIGLWKTSLWWPDNPILTSLGAWSPTMLGSWNGLFLFLAWGVWFRFAQGQKICRFLMISMVAGTVVIAFASPAVIWVAPLFLMSIFELLGRTKSLSSSERVASDRPIEMNPGALRFAFTLMAGLAIWLGFCFSPISSVVLGGHPRSNDQILGRKLPLEAKSYLTQNVPNGILFCPNYWSDWLQTDSKIKVFVDRAQSVPALAAKDYREIFRATGSWEKLIEKYNVQYILADKQNQADLIRNLRRNPTDWKIIREDQQSVYVRKVER